MKRCFYCGDESRSDYHPRCSRELFGVSTPPLVDVELAKLHTLGLAMVGHTSLSGVQRKISVRLNADRATLQVAAEGGQYLLKPQAQTYPFLPENEYVSMRLAQLTGVDVAPCGLVRLKDDSIAYIVRRFDRLQAGQKLHQEDFCQLAEKSPKQKYEGSAELCLRLLQTYADEPLAEVLKLYRLLVVGWWIGNGDMHLKNLSLLRDEDQVHRLSPAYDLVCTRLLIEGDQLALSVGGKRDRLNKETWLQLAKYGGVPERAAVRVLNTVAGVADKAIKTIRESNLPDEMQGQYAQLVETRATTLVG